MSTENDGVILIHDTSRQFLDLNVNIKEDADFSMLMHCKQRQQQSQILPCNLSLSKVSASNVQLTEIYQAQVDESKSLYSDGKGGPIYNIRN